MSEAKYIRANPDLIKSFCKGCGKEILKNNINQIVFFCCGECREKTRKALNG